MKTYTDKERLDYLNRCSMGGYLQAQGVTPTCKWLRTYGMVSKGRSVRKILDADIARDLNWKNFKAQKAAKAKKRIKPIVFAGAKS